MAADDEEPPGVSSGAGEVKDWRALGGIASGLWGTRIVNRRTRALDRDDAGSVLLSDRASVIADRAFELAEAGRDDAAAVAELVGLASGQRRVLENAERFSRQGARHREDREASLAQRLLAAALNGQAVAALSDADARLLEVVEAFEKLSSQEQWAELVTREPRLTELERQTRAGGFAVPRPPRAPREQSAVLRGIAREQAIEHSELGDQLRTLLGPLVLTDDPLLGSRAALGAALAHLEREHPDTSA